MVGSAGGLEQSRLEQWLGGELPGLQQQEL